MFGGICVSQVKHNLCEGWKLLFNFFQSRVCLFSEAFKLRSRMLVSKTRWLAIINYKQGLSSANVRFGQNQIPLCLTILVPLGLTLITTSSTKWKPIRADHWNNWYWKWSGAKQRFGSLKAFKNMLSYKDIGGLWNFTYCPRFLHSPGFSSVLYLII